MIVTTGGDEFFIPDDSHYYFGELDGPKLLRYKQKVLFSFTSTAYQSNTMVFFSTIRLIMKVVML